MTTMALADIVRPLLCGDLPASLNRPAVEGGATALRPALGP